MRMALEQCSQHACSQQVGDQSCYTMSVLLLLQHVIFAACSLGQSQYAYHQTTNSSSLEFPNLQTTVIARVICGANNTLEMYTYAKMVLHHWSKALCCNVLHHGFLHKALYILLINMWGSMQVYWRWGCTLATSLRHGSGACIA